MSQDYLVLAGTTQMFASTRCY